MTRGRWARGRAASARRTLARAAVTCVLLAGAVWLLGHQISVERCEAGQGSATLATYGDGAVHVTTGHCRIAVPGDGLLQAPAMGLGWQATALGLFAAGGALALAAARLREAPQPRSAPPQPAPGAPRLPGQRRPHEAPSTPATSTSATRGTPGR